MKIFISHASAENAVARGFQNWIERFGHVCYCTSNPMNNSAGDNWFNEIIQHATNSDVFIQLLSPYSMSNKWINYESGLATNATKSRIVPVLFGGATIKQLRQEPIGFPSVQAITLDQTAHCKESFQAFCIQTLKIGQEADRASYYDQWTSSLSHEARRVLALGLPGTINPGAVTSGIGKHSFKNGSTAVYIAKHEAGELAAIRLKFKPIRTGDTQHWKFGIALTTHDNEVEGRLNGQDHNEVFMLHASVESNMSTWSLYRDRRRDRPYNLPASLEWEHEAAMSLWLGKNSDEVTAYVRDADSEIISPRPSSRIAYWTLYQDWKFVKIKAWVDGNQQYQTNAEWEIDRAKSKEQT